MEYHHPGGFSKIGSPRACLRAWQQKAFRLPPSTASHTPKGVSLPRPGEAWRTMVIPKKVSPSKLSWFTSIKYHHPGIPILDLENLLNKMNFREWSGSGRRMAARGAGVIMVVSPYCTTVIMGIPIQVFKSLQRLSPRKRGSHGVYPYCTELSWVSPSIQDGRRLSRGRCPSLVQATRSPRPSK